MSVSQNARPHSAPQSVSSVPELTVVPREVPSEVRGIMSDQIMRRYGMAAFGWAENSALQVAMIDPNDIDALNALHFLAEKQGVEIAVYQTNNDVLGQLILLSSQPEGSIKDVISSFSKKSEELPGEPTPPADKAPVESAASPIASELSNISQEFTKPAAAADSALQDTSVARLVQLLVEHALEARASDIHIEPIDKNYRVRFRVDGTLQTAILLPVEIGRSVVARIKILSSLKIDEKRKPQDGRFRVEHKARSVDLRVSTFPVVEGEKVVLRILDTSQGASDLKSLGLEGRNYEVLTRRIKDPYGIILITGPTGSGKSTTLYAFLKILNQQERNIVTLEDPVEYFLNGINQSQVKPEIGYTFANGLRSILRQDPNVIMVGEIRDEETAELSIHAALTGHLVLSTLHTNTAIGAIPRLIDMGIEPFLLSSSLRVAMAQRLVRRVCPHCVKEVTVSPKIQQNVQEILKDVPTEEFSRYGIERDAHGKARLHFSEGQGCDRCHKSGYLGRIAIMEALEVTPKIQEIIVDHRGSEPKIIEEARAQHMLSMRQDGVLKALKGLTTLVEVERATSDSFSLLDEKEEKKNGQAEKTPATEELVSSEE